MPLLQDNKYLFFFLFFCGVPVHHTQMSMIQLN